MTESTQKRGQFTVVSVIGSDERAGIVSDDAYTNALAGETLAYASWVATQLGKQPGGNWSQLAANIYLPVSTEVYPGGPVHLENREYSHHSTPPVSRSRDSGACLSSYSQGLSFLLEQVQVGSND